jgi:ribonuclease BN (tRNA processing enzyme)
MLFGAAPAQASPSAPSRRISSRTRAILVGTAGGPIWRQADGRRGICTVIEVAGARYLVDAGHGASSGLFGAGAIGPADGKNDLTAFRAGFVTHLHSDHVTDLSTFLVQGFIAGGLGNVASPFTLHGPGERGQLPHSFPPGRPTSPPFNPENPTPGTASMVRSIFEAFATDINDRMFDAGSPPINEVIAGRDIMLPNGVEHNFDGPPPRMAPFTVHEDDRVRVTATLVDHGQMVPSYGYRFDTDDGSIAISGDTTLTPNMLELADGSDLLLHEVIDFDSINASISALSVPEEIKEAFRNHMFGAHTTEAQLRQLVRDIDVATLALHHVVPGTLGEPAWRQVAARIGRRSRTEVVAAVDDTVLGI